MNRLVWRNGTSLSDLIVFCRPWYFKYNAKLEVYQSFLPVAGGFASHLGLFTFWSWVVLSFIVENPLKTNWFYSICKLWSDNNTSEMFASAKPFSSSANRTPWPTIRSLSTKPSTVFDQKKISTNAHTCGSHKSVFLLFFVFSECLAWLTQIRWLLWRHGFEFQ